MTVGVYAIASESCPPQGRASMFLREWGPTRGRNEAIRFPILLAAYDAAFVRNRGLKRARFNDCQIIGSVRARAESSIPQFQSGLWMVYSVIGMHCFAGATLCPLNDVAMGECRVVNSSRNRVQR